MFVVLITDYCSLCKNVAPLAVLINIFERGHGHPNLTIFLIPSYGLGEKIHNQVCKNMSTATTNYVSTTSHWKTVDENYIWWW